MENIITLYNPQEPTVQFSKIIEFQGDDLKTIIPLIKQLKDEKTISISTSDKEIADSCLNRGAHIIYDTSLKLQPEMLKIVARHKVPIIITHKKPEPTTSSLYDEVLEIIADFQQKIEEIRLSNIEKIMLLVRPEEYEKIGKIIKRINQIKVLGYPIIMDLTNTEEKSLIGALSLINDVDYLRIKEPRTIQPAIKIANQVK